MQHIQKLILIVVLIVSVTACAQSLDNRIEAGSVVDSARWTVEAMKNRDDDIARLLRANLATARGVAIFPTVTKGAFVVGAQGGTGVVLARGADGTWSYPAFYYLAAGSFGLQAGFQSAQIILVLRSEGAVKSIISGQSKFGGDLQFALGEVGGGISAATTTNLGADIVGFAMASGLYGGMSLEGAGIIRRNDLNKAFYGHSVEPQAILLRGEVSNSQADVLRQTLAGG